MKYGKYILIMAAMVLGLSACLRDSGTGASEGDYVSVELTAGLEDEGGAQIAGTRALSAYQEDYVNNIEVFVFEYNASEQGGQLLYATHGYDIQNTNGSNVKTFKAMLATKIKVGASEVSLVGKKVFLLVVANSHSITGGISFAYGTLYKNVIESLVYEEAGVWDASDSSTQYFPMAALPSSVVTLSGSIEGSHFGNIDLVRAVMAIDVTVDSGDPLDPVKFKLEQVVLRNFPDRGYLSNAIKYNATQPSYVPTSRALVERSYSLDEVGDEMVNEIYVPIAEAMDVTGEHPYILVGGYYDGSTKLTWYRMDLPVSGGKTMATERNYRYIFQIQKVAGPGTTKEEAVTGSPDLWVNTKVIPWKESSHTAEFDGSYYFDANPSQLTLNVSKINVGQVDPDQKHSFELITDYPKGWQLDSITYGAVYVPAVVTSLSAVSGPKDETTTVHVYISSNREKRDRVVYFHFSAGRWTKTVTVTQQANLLKASPRNLKLSFQPFENDTYINRINVTSPFGSEVKSIEYHGSQTNWLNVRLLKLDERTLTDIYILETEANSTEEVREATVTFKQSLGGDNTVTVNVSQGWVDCGSGGEAKPRRIGSREYMTHAYGFNERQAEYEKAQYHAQETGITDENSLAEMYNNAISKPDRYNYRCWMVENSREGNVNAAYKLYNNDSARDKGYYYSGGEAYAVNGPCPDGWRLPTPEDVEISLKYAYTIYGMHNTTLWDYNLMGHAYWYGFYNAYFGYYSFSNNFTGWSTIGRWWLASGRGSEDSYGSFATSQATVDNFGQMPYSSYNLSQSQSDPLDRYNVRCVAKDDPSHLD